MLIRVSYLYSSKEKIQVVVVVREAANCIIESIVIKLYKYYRVASISNINSIS